MTLRSSFRFTYNFTNQSTQYQNGVDMAFGRVFKVGDQPIDASVQGFYNVVRPDNGPA
jgi:hypothetical protein